MEMFFFLEHGAELLCPDHLRPAVPSQEEHPAQRPQDAEHIHGQERNAQAWRLWDIEDPQQRERFRHHRY